MNKYAEHIAKTGDKTLISKLMEQANKDLLLFDLLNSTTKEKVGSIKAEYMSTNDRFDFTAMDVINSQMEKPVGDGLQLEELITQYKQKIYNDRPPAYITNQIDKFNEANHDKQVQSLYELGVLSQVYKMPLEDDGLKTDALYQTQNIDYMIDNLESFGGFIKEPDELTPKEDRSSRYLSAAKWIVNEDNDIDIPDSFMNRLADELRHATFIKTSMNLDNISSRRMVNTAIKFAKQETANTVIPSKVATQEVTSADVARVLFNPANAKLMRINNSKASQSSDLAELANMKFRLSQGYSAENAKKLAVVDAYYDNYKHLDKSKLSQKFLPDFNEHLPEKERVQAALMGISGVLVKMERESLDAYRINKLEASLPLQQKDMFTLNDYIRKCNNSVISALNPIMSRIKEFNKVNLLPVIKKIGTIPTMVVATLSNLGCSERDDLKADHLMDGLPSLKISEANDYVNNNEIFSELSKENKTDAAKAIAIVSQCLECSTSDKLAAECKNNQTELFTRVMSENNSQYSQQELSSMLNQSANEINQSMKNMEVNSNNKQSISMG